MQITYCDRCGKECEDEKSGHVKINAIKIDRNNLDLCAACLVGLDMYCNKGWEVTAEIRIKKEVIKCQ